MGISYRQYGYYNGKGLCSGVTKRYDIVYLISIEKLTNYCTFLLWMIWNPYWKWLLKIIIFLKIYVQFLGQ